MKAGFFRNFRRKTEREKSSGSRGSITVLVTLILVPMVVVNSFMVDLSRLKLYGNQAVMTADAYGEAILSSYDNILKEMYGIFALSDEAAPDGNLAGYLQEYMGSSFNPNKKTILFSYFSDIQDQFHKYSGFMPYKDAEVALSHQRVEQSVLVSADSAAVLASQIGDFMKFRIVQMFLNGENSLMDAYEFVKGMKANNNVISKKRALDKSSTELLDQMKNFYETLKLLDKYVKVVSTNSNEYVSEYYDRVLEVWYDIQDVPASPYYENYVTYNKNPSRYDNAYANDYDEEAEEDCSCTDCTVYLEYYDSASWDDANDCHVIETELNKIEDKLDKLEEYIEDGEGGEVDGRPWSISFKQYEEVVGESLVSTKGLTDYAKKIVELYDTLDTQLTELNGALNNDPNVSEALKDKENGIPKETERLRELLDNYSSDYYTDIAAIYNGDTNCALNQKWEEQANENMSQLEQAFDSVQEGESLSVKLTEPDVTEFESFADQPTLNNLYTELKGIFEAEEGDNQKEMQKKGDEAENKATEIQNTLSNDAPAITPRNVPFTGMGDDAKVDSFNISDILDGGLPDMADLTQLGTELFLKFYVVEYGFGMFSSRVTNMERPDRDNGSVGDAVEDATDIADNVTDVVDDVADAADDVADAADDVADAADGDSGDSEEVETSLTGYHKCRSVNYMYGAELEYLHGGHTESIRNLNDVRNLILTICAVMNFIASYTVPPVNKGINYAASVCPHPAVALVVQAALRLGFTAVETSADWDLLKNRDTAIFYKDQIDDLSVVRAPVSKLDDITGMIPGVNTSDNHECEYDGTDGKTQSGFELELDYEMYLTLMLLTGSTRQLTERVGNLISMNISGVRAGVGDSVETTISDEQKTFDPHTAYTAVDSTCSVQLDFAVIPPGMAAWLLGEEGFSRLQSYSNNTYTFTVTRGY